MSRWGNTLSREEETLDLVSLMQQKKNGVQLLKTENFQTETKNQSSKFTQLIIEPKNRHLLNDLIDIAINPADFMRKTQTIIDKTLTHLAIETITSLTEEFMECVFQNKGSNDDEVIQNDEEYPILHYILRVLTEKGAQQTGLAYLVKLISPFIYQKPGEMIKMISGHNLKYFLQYFHSKSICEVMTKFLEVDSQDNFFQNQKISLVHKICEFVKQEIHNNKQESVIQSFAEFIEYLAEKHEDQYDRSKYAGFLNKIVGQSTYFVFLLSEINHFDKNPAIKTQFLHCIKAYLRIHMPIKKDERKSQEAVQKLQISEPFLSSLISYLQQHSVATFDSQIRQQLLNYYEIVKKILILEPSAVPKVINALFFEQTFRAMQKDPENNILHNIQKDIILTALTLQIQVSKILENDSQLLFLLQKYLKTENSNVSFQNQLFLIGQAVKPNILVQLKSGWKAIEQTLQDKRKFYLTQIGGNPRKKKDKWADFQDQIFQKTIQNKAEKLIKEDNVVRVFNNTDPVQSDLFGLQGAEVLSNEIDEMQRQPRHDDFFTSDIPSSPSFSLTMSGQFFNGESWQGKLQKSSFFSKCESIYLTPAREQIQTILKGKYNLKLSGNLNLRASGNLRTSGNRF